MSQLHTWVEYELDKKEKDDMMECTEKPSAASAVRLGSGCGLLKDPAPLSVLSLWYVTLTVTARCPLTLSQGGGVVDRAGLDHCVCVFMRTAACVLIVSVIVSSLLLQRTGGVCG